MNINVNLKAPYILMSEFSKQKFNKKDQGNIINVIDQRVFNLTPFFFSYTLSKVALYNLTITSAMRLAPNIRVNCIAPGPVIKNLRLNEDQFKKQYMNIGISEQHMISFAAGMALNKKKFFYSLLLHSLLKGV